MERRIGVNLYRTFAGQYRISILKELFRKLIHLCSAFVPLFASFSKILTLSFLGLSLVLYTASEFFRLKGIRIPLVSKVTEAAARKRDENRFVLGPVTLVVGIMLSLAIWKIEYATLGIFALAFGDGLASLFGKLFGRIHIPFTNGKTAAGSLTCFAAVLVSSFLLLGNSLESLVLAFIAMILEMLPMTDFDNIILPVMIGGIAQFLAA